MTAGHRSATTGADTDDNSTTSGGVGVAAMWGATRPARRRLRAWARTEPDLVGQDWDRLTGLLWDATVDWDRKDDVLAALIRVSRSDPEATAAVAVCLSPGLWAHARGLVRLIGHDDGWGEILAGLCDRIARYDLDRRPTRIAANLIWDARQHLRTAVRAHLRHVQHTCPEPHSSESRSTPAPELSVETILTLAEQAGVIAPIDAALITATRLTGSSLKEAAALLGVDYEAAKKRRQRAEANLASWWNATEATPARPTRPAQIIPLPLRVRNDGSAASEG